MNNAMMNKFTISPTSLDVKRSRFDRPFKHTTTFDAGKIIPFYVEEVLPGDSVSLDLSTLVRETTPIHPVMDNAYLEIHFFFVPNRLVWEHWEAFMGQNDTNNPWLPPTSYSIPQIQLVSQITSGKFGSGNHFGTDSGSILDYMGVPVDIGNSNGALAPTISALPVRAYCKVWNDWYRSEIIQAPVNIPLGDSTVANSNSGLYNATDYLNYTAANTGSNVYVNTAYKGAAPLPVCKYHDFFTSATKAPQRGPDVTLPLGQFAPVVDASTVAGAPLNLYQASGSPLPASVALGSGTNGYAASYSSSSLTPAGDVYIRMAADLQNATSATINTIRWAFQLQKYYEKLSLGGSRYNEMIQSFFGVHVPDERLQRSEFLGGRRIPLNMTQVAQTSSTDNTSPQGNLSAFSQTADNHSYFTKSFVEHGYLLGMMMVRTDRTYQQGLNKMWTRKDMIDFYNPVFSNVGEMPIYNREIWLQGQTIDNPGTGTNPGNGAVFGYQEAWAEYRYSPNRVSGAFRSKLTASLDSYHYADYYTSLPALYNDWIIEPQANVQRTLAVSGQPQFMADIQVSSVWTRVMPLFSIPGLVDHH